MRPSYLYNVNLYTGKTSPLYWDGSQSPHSIYLKRIFPGLGTSIMNIRWSLLIEYVSALR